MEQMRFQTSNLGGLFWCSARFSGTKSPLPRVVHHISSCVKLSGRADLFIKDKLPKKPAEYLSAPIQHGRFWLDLFGWSKKYPADRGKSPQVIWMMLYRSYVCFPRKIGNLLRIGTSLQELSRCNDSAGRFHDYRLCRVRRFEPGFWMVLTNILR